MLHDAYKTMWDSRTDTAWPYIARLTAQYMVADKAPDSFFRSACRLLESLEESELKFFIALVERSCLALQRAEKGALSVTNIRWGIYGQRSDVEPGIQVIVNFEDGSKQPAWLVQSDDGRVTFRIFSLIETSGLFTNDGSSLRMVYLLPSEMKSLSKLFTSH